HITTCKPTQQNHHGDDSQRQRPPRAQSPPRPALCHRAPPSFPPIRRAVAPTPRAVPPPPFPLHPTHTHTRCA
ncbi:hypothetical protein PLICRDRAFT_38356, partial [Plicaturopsis crispa FD-325 SS-3]